MMKNSMPRLDWLNQLAADAAETYERKASTSAALGDCCTITITADTCKTTAAMLRGYISTSTLFFEAVQLQSQQIEAQKRLIVLLDARGRDLSSCSLPNLIAAWLQARWLRQKS